MTTPIAPLFVARLALFVLAGSALAASGCSDPTLEEACAAYCDAIASAGCDRPTSEECSAQCDSIREQLNGECVEEYTEVFDCGADIDFECVEGNAANTEGACLEEAFELLECTGFGTDTATTDPASISPE